MIRITSMAISKPGFRFYGGFLVLLLGTLTLGFVAVANGPDKMIRHERRVPSPAEAARLGQELGNPEGWTNWFHSLIEVQFTPPFHAGSTLKLIVDSRKNPWSRFELRVKVTEFEPGRRLKLSILEDSKGKITALFDRLEWTVAIEPAEKGSIITGITEAHTRNWRARLFGTIAKNILLHQAYYPNLIKLAELTQLRNQENFSLVPAGP